MDQATQRETAGIAVCIAAMHRSGTSMVARALQLAGLYLGPDEDMMGHRPDNPSGFWENLRFVGLNDDLLNELGGAWDCPPPPTDWSASAFDGLRAEARAVLAEFEGHGAWGWKDPRSAITLPFWTDLVGDLRVVATVRNPLEVAASLRRRNATSLQMGLTLWLRYNEAILAATRPEQRLVTHYETFLAQPDAELRRLLEGLGVEASDDAIARGAASVAGDQRHERFSAAQLAEAGLAASLLRVYAQLCDEAGRTEPGLAEAIDAAAAGEHERALGRGAVPEPAGRVLRAAVDNSAIGVDLSHLRRHVGQQAAAVERLAAQVTQLSAQLARVGDRQDQMFDEADAILAMAPPHLRDHAAQQRERRQVARAVERCVPAGASVLIVGDDGGPVARALAATHGVHRFPQDIVTGEYTSEFPARSGGAIAQLEYLRAQGAEYLVFPPPARRWWLRHYEAFARHLRRHFPLLADGDDAGAIFALAGSRDAAPDAWEADVAAAIADFRVRFDRDPSLLDWTPDGALGAAFQDEVVFRPAGEADALPHLDASVDLVVVPDVPKRAADAERVAGAAVITLAGAGRDTAARRPGRPTVRWKPVSGAAAPPSASIVIPSWNGIEFTEPCVLALMRTLPANYDTEIIVVDDASTDDTQERLARIAAHEPRLRVLLNEENSGFLWTSNRGAREARGDYVVMLNNDTIPLPGWLEPLLGVFRSRPDAGASTGKLLFPDGTLQEAGGVIFSDARAANFGKWDPDPEDPLYSYVREVDYGSGALLALPRELWYELGGFSEMFRPIYCEDSDLCFKVRARGLRVYYQPECQVVHIEGATSGRDESQGDKRYQRINRGKFAEKWAEQLEHQPAYPDGFSRRTLHDIVVREPYDAERVSA